jgi:hypothetical protein
MMQVTDMPHSYFLSLAHYMPKWIRDVLANQGQSAHHVKQKIYAYFFTSLVINFPQF